MDKVVLITGCSSGIGLETAIACAKEGHTIFATMRNLNKKSELEKRIKKEKLEERIKILELDISDSSSIVDAVASIVRQTKKIDVLFNNAGYRLIGSLEDITISEIREQINTNLTGPMHLTKTVLPHMKDGEEPGLIINMSAIPGKIGFSLSTSYCASKFGIEGFTDSLRREMIHRNVNVCLIEAGIVHTKFFDNMKITKRSHESEYAKETEKMKTRFKKIINSKRWTMPEDIAKKVIEIINENGTKVRYVIGSDAVFLINATYYFRDDYERMDDAIKEIMRDYLK